MPAANRMLNTPARAFSALRLEAYDSEIARAFKTLQFLKWAGHPCIAGQDAADRDRPQPAAVHLLA